MNYPLLVLLIVTTALFFGFFMQNREKRRLLPILMKQAEKRGGRVTKGALFALPQLQLNIRGREARLVSMSRSMDSEESGRNITCIELFLSSPSPADLRVQERRTGLKASLDNIVPGQSGKLLFGDPVFDERFQTTASDSCQARKILETGGLFRTLLRLPAGADFQIIQGKCVLSVEGFPDNEAFIDNIIEAASDILEALERP
jgi:hypothetical protein